MKNIIILSIVSVFLASAAHAQIPKDIQDFKTSNGIHVILRQTTANQVISAVLGFEGGLAYNETDNASVASGTAGLIAVSGSDKFPKEAYRDSLSRLSTTIAGTGSLYHINFTLKTIKPNFNSAWAIFTDVLLHPHYDTLEAQKLQEQSIKAIESRQSDPESYSAYLADSLWKGSSRLNRVPTEDEVGKLTISDLMKYRDAQFQRSRMLLVVVGNVSRADLESKLAALGSLPMGNFTWPKIDRFMPMKDQFMYISKPADFPTTYVDMRCPSAAVQDKDWWAERILLEVLDKRLFDEVRTKRNLAYSPSMYPTGNYTNFDLAASLQSVLPDSATHVVFDVFRDLQKNQIPADELRRSKEGRITTYYYIAQENLRQAQILYTDQVEAGDWKLFFNIVPETEKVTAAQIQEAAKKYLHGFTFVLMGPEGKVTRDVYHFE
jgi:zinc protease